MRKNTVKVSREQMGILQHLDKESIRYVAVGDFAMLALDPARMLQQAQLWIEPVKQNLQRLNQALKNAFGPRTTRQVDTNSEVDTAKTGRQFSVGIGPFRVGIYFNVGGFRPEDFEQVHRRSQTEKVAVPGGQEGGLEIKRLNNQDLSRQLRTEAAPHAGWNLRTINDAEKQVVSQKNGLSNAGLDHKGQNVLYDISGKMSGRVEQSESRPSRPIEGSNTHKGQNVPYASKPDSYPLPPIRDVDEIRQRMSVEAALHHYGFKPEAVPIPNDPWRIYERNVDGQQQRIVVGTLKETRQQHFYEIGNRSFQGDVLDLVGGLERPLRKPHETLEQRVFRTVDDWLTSSAQSTNENQVLAMRPISKAYLLGTGASLNEQAVIEQYGLKALTNTTALETSAISKTTLYAPEFDGRIKNVVGAKHSPGSVGFPMTDAAGRVIDVAVVEPQQVRKVGQQSEETNAQWQSNRFYRTKVDVPILSGETITAGTVGLINRADAKQLTFHYQQDGQARTARLPVQEGKSLFAEQSAMRLVIGPSPVDLLALKQLNPEIADERRLYVATSGTPTVAQRDRIEQLLHKNPQAQLVLMTNQEAEGYRTVINQLSLTHPAANSALRVLPEIRQINAVGSERASDQTVGSFFYPNEPTLRNSEDLLKRFGYHTYGQPFGEPTQTTGIDPVHIERLMSGKRGITTGTDKPSTYSDNLTLNALASALTYAELHRIPLSDQLKVLRDTPIMKAMLQEEKQDMRRVYEENYRGKNQLTVEVRQPANQPVGAKQNNQFLNRFVNTLTMTANQMQAQTYPQRALDIAFQPDRPVQEMNRQTFLDPKNGQVVTRSTIVLPNETRVLGKATQLLANEINERQGQQLINIMQPGPQHKTMTEMLSARQGQPLSPTHRSGIGLPEPIRPQIDRPDQQRQLTTAERSPVERMKSVAVKVG